MNKVKHGLNTCFLLLTTMALAQGPSLIIKGNVSDKGQNTAINKAVVEMYDLNKKLVISTTSSSEGAFELNLNTPIETYKVIAKAEDFNQAEVLIQNSKSIVEINFGLIASKIQKHIEPQSMLYFDFDSSFLTGQSKQDLQKIINYLNQEPLARIRLTAHTDSRGSETYNNWLSARRAKQVKDFLVTKGSIAEDRIEVHHFGKSKLINNCTESVACNEQQHRENRRCSIEIIK